LLKFGYLNCLIRGIEAFCRPVDNEKAMIKKKARVNKKE
jgi:hypothetical protein